MLDNLFYALDSFQFNKEVMKKINIEIGKLKGWLKTPDDIVSEFNISKEESLKFFENDLLVLMNEKSNQLLLK